MIKNEEKNRNTSMGGQVIISEEEKKFFADNNNFIDYFIEVGVKPDIFANDKITPNSNLNDINSQLSPEIISKFPYFEKKSMGIEDESLINFIFSHGFRAEIKTQKPEPYFFSLILDNQFYSSVYSYKFIACLIIYESLSSYKKVYDLYSNNENDNKSNNCNMPKDTFKNIFVPKCLCLASVHPAINKFESILRGIYSYIQMGKNFFIDIIIEKLISQTPKIPRGLKKFYLKFSDNNIIELTQRKMNELVSVDINLKELFSIFSTDKIVDIFKFLLYETKTVFFGSKTHQVTNIIMCFLLLLKPFTYQYQILSVLPKDNYSLLVEPDIPWIFGINESYFDTFFEDINLNVENRIMLIVDIDKKVYFLKFGGGKIKEKDLKKFPPIPKHLREKLDKRIEDYKKNKKIEETNEGYQEIFYRFMINLLKDYPKFLKKKFNGNSKKLDDMIDKEAYINSQSNKDKEFYEKIIKSQMFNEFITKRMMPRDQREKIQALFFEEKLNVKLAQKKLIGGSKLLAPNTLLPSKEYDYKEPKEIIDLSENGLFSALDEKVIEFFYRPNVDKTECLPRGFNIREGGIKGQLLFDYYIFPSLLSEKLFKYNCKNYIVPSTLYSRKIEELNNSIINRCFIKFDDIRKNYNNELLNDIYISYLIIFSLTFWYTDKEEREYRFNNMIQILEKIELHNSEVIELLFNTFVNLGEEDLAIILHTQFLNLHLNPTSKIFSMVSKILKKKQSMYSENSKEIKKSVRSSLGYGNRSMVQKPKKNIDTKIFRTRTIKLPGIDDDILGEQIIFDSYGICLECNGVIKIAKICSDLDIKEMGKDNRFKGTCKCNNWNLQKINFTIGTELYNKTISLNNSSSFSQGIMLFSPTTLKKRLLEISNSYYNNEFDVENFRVNYPDEFWNALWYMELKGIDISFMLPYLKPTRIKCLQSQKEIRENIESLQFFFNNNSVNKKGETIKINIFKNPNSRFENNDKKEEEKKKKKKKEIIYKKFNSETLVIQHAFQIGIINIIGMVSYLPQDEYKNNVGFSQKILLITRKEDIKKNIEDNEEKNYYKKKSILNSNNSIYSELNLSNLNKTINTTVIENAEEYNNLMDGNYKIEDIAGNVKNNKKNTSKVHFNNEILFEMMKEDDDNYNALDDYKEDDGSGDSDY